MHVSSFEESLLSSSDPAGLNSLTLETSLECVWNFPPTLQLRFKHLLTETTGEF